MIQVDDIFFQIDGFVLEHVSLHVLPGEYFVLLGPPGSGKTLLLETLCGLRRLESGCLIVDGQNVTDLEPRRRMIGYVPQDYALFPHRTVKGNIRFGLETQGLSKNEIDRRVGAIAEQLHITHLMERQVAGLSGGERQKVSLGRALVIQPKVLLLDEPVSALDESTRETICKELKRIQNDLGLTTIHVCHQLQEAFSVADRAGILRHGSFQQIGTMSELTQHPQNEFVARFMRCENIISGHAVGLADRDEKTEIEAGCHRFKVPGHMQGAVQFVIRPEQLLLEREGRTPTESFVRFPVEIRSVSDQGTYIRLELDASFPLVLHASMEDLTGLDLSPGTRTTVQVRRESVHFLEA